MPAFRASVSRTTIIAVVVALALVTVSIASAVVVQPQAHEPNDSPETATRIADGETQEGTISATDDLDYYAIAVDGPSQLTVEVTKDIGNNSTLFADVLAPDEERLSSITLESNESAGEASVTVNQSGTYYIRMSGAENVSYSLTVTTHPF